MAKNVTLLGANYPGVPAVTLPQTGGGTATFVDADELLVVKRSVVITASVNANQDKSISYNDIINGVSSPPGSDYSVLSICTEGAYPNTTWGCKPLLLYINSANTWSIHNIGESADTVTATFIVTYVKNS